MLDFVVVGPMKTGTSWVHEFLSWHKQVSVPTTVKETYYFSANYHKGQDWLDKLFEKKDGTLVTGEVGPTYFPDLRAAKLVHKHNPNAKIVITLREPYERFLSHYHHNVRGGFIELGTPLDKVYSDMAGVRGHSQYLENILLWRRIFGKNNISILLYEDLHLRPQRFISALCHELGIQDCEMPESLNKKVGERRVPHNAYLSRSAAKIVKYLRKKDMHLLVNTAKKAGISDMFYSKKEPQNDYIDGGEKVISIFREESKRLEEDLGVDLSQWISKWNEKL